MQQYLRPATAALALCLLAFCVSAHNIDYQFHDGGKIEDFQTYTNTSIDVAEIQALCKAGNFAAANQIYSVGKNAYRNITAGTFRFAKSVATSAVRHSGEAYYEAFKQFYKTETFLDSWLGGALNGTGEYTERQFRTGACVVYAQVYSWVYILHEIDVGLLGITTYTGPLRTIPFRPASAIAECDDSVALFIGKGASAPLAVAKAAAKHACISGKAVDAQISGVWKGFRAAQAAAISITAAAEAAQTKNTTVSADTQAKAAAAYKKGRDQMVDYVTRSWLQMCLQHAKEASRSHKAADKAYHQAAAIAAFRAVAPFINEDNNVTVQVVMKALTNLKPSTFSLVRIALDKFYCAQGVNFKKEVYGCKV